MNRRGESKIYDDTAHLAVMYPRSKPLLAFLIALPLALVVVMWPLSQRRPRLVATLGAPASALALSRDGANLGILGQDGGVSLWSRDTNQRLALPAEGKKVFNVLASAPSVNLSSDGRTLFASNVRSSNGSTVLYAWDVPTRQIKWSWVFAPEDNVKQFPPTPSGKVVMMRPLDVVKVFDTSSGGTPLTTKLSKFAHSFPGVEVIKDTAASKSARTWPQTADLSPDGQTLALSFPDGHLEFWDVATSQKKSQVAPSRIATYGNWELRYSPDSRYVALFQGSQLALWDTASQKWTLANVASAGSETALVWMPDSRSLWTGAGSTQQWSVPSLASLRDLPVSGPLAVSGDGKTLATRNIPSSGINGVWLWNIG